MKFYIFEKLSNYNPMTLEPPLRGLAIPKIAKKYGFMAAHDNLNIYKNGVTEMYCTDQREKAAKATFKMLLKNPKIAHRVHAEMIRDSLKMFSECQRIAKINLAKLSLAQIRKKWEILDDCKFKVHTPRCLGWLMETRYEILSKYIIFEIQKIIEKRGLKLDPDFTARLLLWVRLKEK